MKKGLPKISIVTPSYNQGAFLEETIKSVIAQNYPNLEYFIMDGGSTDNSVEIINKYEQNITWWVSEPDGGQPAALNKAFSRATGEIFGFINSDDMYCPGILHEVAEAYCRRNGNNRFWIAFTVLNMDDDKALTKSRTVECQGVPEKYYRITDWMNMRASLHQPGVFWSKTMHEDIGGFDETLPYGFDRKFFMSALLKGYRYEIRPDFVASCFRYHDESKTMSRWEDFKKEFEQVSQWAKDEAAGIQWLWIRVGESREKGLKILYKALEKKDSTRSQRLKLLGKALIACPLMAFQRIFWGAVKRVVFII